MNTAKHLPGRPATQSAWAELAACAEPIRTRDRLAKLIAEMTEAACLPGHFHRRILSIAADVEQMERHCDAQVEQAMALADELARPGSNVTILRSA